MAQTDASLASSCNFFPCNSLWYRLANRRGGPNRIHASEHSWWITWWRTSYFDLNAHSGKSAAHNACQFQHWQTDYTLVTIWLQIYIKPERIKCTYTTNVMSSCRETWSINGLNIPSNSLRSCCFRICTYGYFINAAGNDKVSLTWAEMVPPAVAHNSTAESMLFHSYVFSNRVCLQIPSSACQPLSHFSLSSHRVHSMNFNPKISASPALWNTSYVTSKKKKCLLNTEEKDLGCHF